jgi:hypothetical protein
MSEKKPQSQDSTPDQTPQEGVLQPATPQEQPPLEAKPGQPGEPKKLDETVPGGRYKTPDGRTVNANGEPIDENGKVIKPS